MFSSRKGSTWEKIVAMMERAIPKLPDVEAASNRSLSGSRKRLSGDATSCSGTPSSAPTESARAVFFSSCISRSASLMEKALKDASLEEDQDVLKSTLSIALRILSRPEVTTFTLHTYLAPL